MFFAVCLCVHVCCVYMCLCAYMCVCVAYMHACESNRVRVRENMHM